MIPEQSWLPDTSLPFLSWLYFLFCFFEEVKKWFFKRFFGQWENKRKKKIGLRKSYEEESGGS